MKTLMILISVVFMFSCSHEQKKDLKVQTHTMKLKSSLLLDFKSISLIKVKLSKDTSNASLKILGVDENKNQTLILEQEIFESSDVSIDQTQDLTSYKLIVATLEGRDSSDNKISEVAVYRVGEQEEINKARRQIKSLRK